MRVSVVIPAFNDQLGVNACLEAMSSQTYPQDRIEVIVVDNGSAPPLALDRAYPFSVRMIQCAILGSYAARNAGVRVASGEMLVFTDADCRAEGDWIARGISRLELEGGKSVIGGEVSLVKPEKATAAGLYQWVVGFDQEVNIHTKGFSATANLFCTRAQFERVGAFDERLLSGGDREWCWRAVKCGIKMGYEPNAVVYTAPRQSLCAAVRQARRVVAGRRALKNLGLAHLGIDATRRHRSAWQSIAWILSNPKLSWPERIRIVSAATVIRTAAAAEGFRLALGSHAERR